MGTDTVSFGSRESFLYTWGAGVGGGLLGGLGMGVVLHAGANIMPFIGALYGQPTVLGGWIAHLTNSVLLGLLFALIVSRWRFHDRTTNLFEWAIYGIVYAAAIGLVTGGIMVPATLHLMDVTVLPQPALPMPGITGSLLVAFSVGVAHVVYGVLLGTVYGRVHAASEERVE